MANFDVSISAQKIAERNYSGRLRERFVEGFVDIRPPIPELGHDFFYLIGRTQSTVVKLGLVATSSTFTRLYASMNAGIVELMNDEGMHTWTVTDVRDQVDLLLNNPKGFLGVEDNAEPQDVLANYGYDDTEYIQPPPSG